MANLRCPHAVLLLVLSLPGCSEPTPSEAAGRDQEITRNILWRFHQDPRFSEVQVRCENRQVTLEGRVSDVQAAEEALQIARDCSGGRRAFSNLSVRMR